MKITVRMVEPPIRSRNPRILGIERGGEVVVDTMPDLIFHLVVLEHTGKRELTHELIFLNVEARAKRASMAAITSLDGIPLDEMVAALVEKSSRTTWRGVER